MENSIKKFVDDRKEKWLSSRIKASMTDEKKEELNNQAEEKFAFNKWIPDAARRASHLTIVSHPAKFSHPSIKKEDVSFINATAEYKPDGYLRTGNCKVTADITGSGASLDVYQLLSLEIEGDTLLTHLENRSETAKKLLTISTVGFEELRDGFLKIKKDSQRYITSNKVKQVYFPCGDSSHLLSILTPSGLLFELHSMVQRMHFSEQTKNARDLRRKGEHSKEGYSELYGLTKIGFGGSKPHNISNLNSKNGGQAHLLPCTPPRLEKRSVRLPKYNFFGNIWYGRFRKSFYALHKLFMVDYNNMHIRDGIDNILCYIIDRIIDDVWAIRGTEIGWTQREAYSMLSAHHKIWLDDINKEERESTDGWLDKVISEFSNWIINSYEKILGSQSVPLSNDFNRHVKKLIDIDKEALR